VLALLLIALISASLAGLPAIDPPDAGRSGSGVTPPPQITPSPSGPAEPVEPGVLDAILSLTMVVLLVGVVLVVAYLIVRAVIARARA